LRSLYESKKLSPADVAILTRSDPYVDYVWAAQPGLRANVRSKISEALLELDPLQEDDAEILSLQQCRGYLPAQLDDFERIREIAVKSKFLGAD
jgi:ABC-type phosphate/phosphonate transport system substrate-binding protein